MDTTLQDPLVGQTLDGRYRVVRRVAVGGMATVYRAVDTRLDRIVAVKVMHPGLAADAGFVERFIREAKAAAGLAHANVVGVYDQSADGPYVYLAMEYVAGCTLRDVLRERGALTPRAALDILEPVLAALSAAHRAGLVHRDMKPENVLIGDDGRVKVADFGLVRAVDTQTSHTSGSILGTVSYMAPEQIEYGASDPRSDVYACGVLLYEMLTGAKPHSGGTAAQILYQHLNEPVAPPSALVPGLAPELDAIVADATARDADLRPADAVALLGRLQTARQHFTLAELDTPPPAAHAPAGHAPAAGPEELTAVVPPVQHTQILHLDPGLDGVNGFDGHARPDTDTARLARPPAPRPRRLSGPLTLVTALLLVVGIGAGVWYITDGQFTSVPAVADHTKADAERALRSAGLGVDVTTAFSPTVARGKVIGSRPGDGGRIRDHGTVTLIVSRGPDRVAVPDVTGRTLASARKRLTAVGLQPGTVTREFSDSAAAGTVVSTDPDAGTSRAGGSAVALTVSKGSPVDVPDVTGASTADAQQQLTDAGLKVVFAATPVFSPTADKGTVALQSVKGGGRAAQGDTITLTISKGPELTDVPDVTGKSEDDAKQVLEAAGFQVNVNHLFFGDTVFSQTPDAGSQAAKGSTVTVWVK